MLRSMRAIAVVLVCGAVGTPLAAQAPEFSACYVPAVGAVYLIKRAGLPGACVAAGHLEIGWTGATGGGGLTSLTAGAGLTGGTITTTGTIAVDFAGGGAATTVARSDHTHAVADRNTRVGSGALAALGTGFVNTAVGNEALNANVDGNGMVAVGHRALYAGTAGNNTAVGTFAAMNGTTGTENTALGHSALISNLTGTQNTAVGHLALSANTGSGNTGVGRYALIGATGTLNTALGTGALPSVTGNFNIGIGTAAGQTLTTGGFNIMIGSIGAATDNATIRLGEPGVQTRTFVAGVRGIQTDDSDVQPVLVSGTGQLGTVASSQRFKQNIHDMGDASRRLLDLRPVSFEYIQPNSRGDHPLQYGLIAEEVAKAFPELAIVDSTGQAETVRYHILPVLLLNEVQRQAKELAELRQLLAEQKAVVDELRKVVGEEKR